MICDLDNPYILIHEKKLFWSAGYVACFGISGSIRSSSLIIAEDVEERLWQLWLLTNYGVA